MFSLGLGVLRSPLELVKGYTDDGKEPELSGLLKAAIPYGFLMAQRMQPLQPLVVVIRLLPTRMFLVARLPLELVMTPFQLLLVLLLRSRAAPELTVSMWGRLSPRRSGVIRMLITSLHRQQHPAPLLAVQPMIPSPLLAMF